MSDLDAMDEWCRARIDKITAEIGSYVMSGGNMNAPKYRTLLGRSHAYNAMRSFIHGARRASHPTS